MRMTAALHPGMFFPRPTAVFASLAPPQAPAEGKLPAMRQKQPTAIYDKSIDPCILSTTACSWPSISTAAPCSTA